MQADAQDPQRPESAPCRAGIDDFALSPRRPGARVGGAAGGASVVVGKLRESKSETFGYDAQNGEFCDLVKEGIVDPAKVVRTALQDAASVASLLIATEAMVAEKPDRSAPPGRAPTWAGWTSKRA